MPQSLAHVLVHLVFSTKNREPTIARNIRPALHAYLGGILDRLGCSPLAVGGAADHVHILFSLSRILSLAEVVEETKKASSKWMKQTEPDFWWQAGYGAFSVAHSQVTAVIRYIERQEQRHRAQSFQDEFRQLLTRFQLPYDERYLWD
jgi:REP-associated tyrosine transposase